MAGFLDDAFLVVLPDGTREFVVVHSRAVLASSPQLGHLAGVLDLEDTCNTARQGLIS